MRRIIPYVVYSKKRSDSPGYPMDYPTRAYSSHFGDTPATHMLDTRGKLSEVTPVQNPIPAQGARFPAFPFALPSDVAPNAIRKNYIVARNLYSPTAHSKADNLNFPAQSRLPTAVIPGPQRGRRGTGGGYTIPNPLSAPSWPTSAQWLRTKSMAGIPTPQPAGGHPAEQFVLTGYDGRGRV